jgi:hypothetical protein
VAQKAAAAGLTPEQTVEVLDAMPAEQRADGNVAEGFKPTAEVLADPAIPEAQKAAIRKAQAKGVRTATSHVTPEGNGVAIGVDADGDVRRVEVDAPTAKPGPRPLDQARMDADQPPDAWLMGAVKAREQQGMGPREAMQDAVAEWRRQGEMGRAAQPEQPRQVAGRAGATDALSRALFGEPETPGPTLGALGGASRGTAAEALSVPRNVVAAPGKALNAPVSRFIRSAAQKVAATAEAGIAAGEAAATKIAERVARIPGWAGRAARTGVAPMRFMVDGVKAARRVARVAYDRYSLERDTMAAMNEVGYEREGASMEANAILGHAKASRTPEQTEAGMRFLEGRGDRAEAVRAMGEDAVKALERARMLIDAESRRGVDLGTVGKEAAEQYGPGEDGSPGTYLRRDYTNRPEDTLIEDAARLVSGKRIPPNHMKHDKPWVSWREGAAQKYRKFETVEEAEAFAKDLAKQAREEIDFNKANAAWGQRGGPSKIRSIETGDAVPEEIRKAWGEVRDPFTVAARTLLLQTHRNAIADALGKIARNGRLSMPASKDANGKAVRPKDLPDSFSDQPIPDDPKYGKLAGQYVARAVRNEVIGAMERVGGLRKVMRWADRLTSAWKAGKTSLNPGTHVRNVLGNQVFEELAGISRFRPTDYQFYRAAVRLLRAKPGSEMWGLRKQLVREGLGAEGSIGSDLDSVLELAERMKAETWEASLTGAGNALAKVPGAAKWLYAMEDVVPKLAASLKVYKQTGSAKAAADHAKAYFPHYLDNPIAPLIRGRSVGKWMVRNTVLPPFIQFQVEAIRILGRHAVERPVSVAVGLASLYGLKEGLAAMSGLDEDKREAMRALSPDWMPRDGAGVWLMPWKDENGNPTVLDLRNVLPGADMVSDLVDPGNANSTMTSLINNPLVAPIQDVLANRDRYWRGDVASKDASEEEQVEQVARYLYDAWMPSLLTKLVPAGKRDSSIGQAMTGRADRSGKVPDMGRAILNDLAGIPVRSADLWADMGRLDAATRGKVLGKKSAIRAALKSGDTAEADRLIRDVGAIVKDYEERRAKAARAGVK